MLNPGCSSTRPARVLRTWRVVGAPTHKGRGAVDGAGYEALAQTLLRAPTGLPCKANIIKASNNTLSMLCSGQATVFWPGARGPLTR